jgi:hypothetical protein
MLYAIDFKAEHIMEIQPSESARWVQEATVSDLRVLEGPYALTVMEDGKPIAAAGVIPYWENRAHLWTFIGAGMERKAHRFVRQFLKGVPFKRIEAAVEVGFDAGYRWAEYFGFVRETPEPARAFWPNGRDAYLYSLVR